MRSPPEPRRGRGRPAKNPDSNSKSTKIVTAAAKARSAVPSNLTANTKSTAAKRKTRTDDAEEEQQASLAKRPRGRPPKKPVEEHDNGAAKPAGAASAMASTGASRAKVNAKKGVSEIAKEEPAAPKPTRGRPRKVVSKPEESDKQPQPPKKATRGRPPTVMKSASTTTTTGANKPPVKKVVKFREPDKENVEPAASPPEPAPTGMRGRPARRGGAAATRTTTRPAAKPSKPQGDSKKPLSPKKITQLTLTQYDSEDELSLEKPLTKSPIKPPSKKSEMAPIEIEPEMSTVAVNTAMFDLPELNATLFGSPARRPTSPPRDTIKSPAKRIAMPLPGSALKLSNEPVAQTPFKSSSTLLQSAAKRPQSPMKPFIFSAQKQPANEIQSTTKPSMLQSPAKRAFPGFKSLSDTRHPDLPTLDESPIATPSRPAKASQKLLIEEDEHKDEYEDEHEDEEDDPFAVPIIDLRFSRSPSTAPFRQADLVSAEEEAEEEVEADVQREAEIDSEEEAGDGDEVEDEDEAQEEGDEAEAEVDREATAEAEVEGALEIEEEGVEEEEEEELQPAADPETLEAEEDAGEETEEEADDAAEDSIIVATEESDNIPTETEDMDADEGADEEDNEGHNGGEDEDEDDSEDTMVLDDHATEEEEEEEDADSSPKVETPADALYQLREKDLDPCHDMSSMAEDADDTLPFERLAATPSVLEETTPRTRTSAMKGSRRSTLGFSSLSDQLGSWSAASPVKHAVSFAEEPELSYAQDHENLEDEIAENIEEQDVDEETMIMDEDAALAQETNEMTLSDPMEGEDTSSTRQSFDDSLSDASQEYGDENQVPVESAVPIPEPRAAPVTPVGRPMTRSFNTTTKIPTKPAVISTPSPLKKKSFSASRAAPKRPDQPKRGAPVLSYSPKKQQQPLRRSSRNISAISEEPDQRIEPSTPVAEAEKASKVETPEQSVEPSTPESKADLWAKMGTPARTPRKDLNSNLLRGAIVFVDVHTSEGADASGIFVELLTQMGARCLQKWSWNPNSASNSESTKVGITHVVFKDGSKRTLEKVRQANGVVQCVGVSWVLDCERDNKWLDESPYHIDTSYVPRGGARRRKSMEPKTVSNQNGSAVSGSPKGRRESAPPASSSPKTPNRRQSSIWIHTPSDTSEEQEEKEEEDIEWSNMILTPVPKTPAPEALMKFATETPSNLEDEDEYEDDESPSLRREELMTRTCPPKAQRFVELGGGILSRDSDENVMMRLMAARRKSLQFAPKVGSPLAKMWH
ncbi:hypothetical protein TGAMA5MH_10462 [Trichoderma gamsii]|uniref:BRCT domain-containing protein n=1 Tax=Trichoderma gamsii TaxID=398673 RepID=A0A2K0SWG6_9HYPO|nr:hypothetical protein TGAMA5MH_10462 [Trichoderma gamsii]